MGILILYDLELRRLIQGSMRSYKGQTRPFPVEIPASSRESGLATLFGFNGVPGARAPRPSTLRV